ncbi:hypothetical protein T492DRAFT_1069930 [Pavlovales sp. CCMP2436]|nr:hypothetical protein T492DRAFT_1069930 [Pavlovales sp. CCMP2436]
MATVHPAPSEVRTVQQLSLLDDSHAEGRRRTVATRTPLLCSAAAFIVAGLSLDLSFRNPHANVWLIPLAGAISITGGYLGICSVLPTDRRSPYLLCALLFVLVPTVVGLDSTSVLADARATCSGVLTDEQRATGKSADDCPFSYAYYGTTLFNFCVALVLTARSLRVLVSALCYGPRPREARISSMNSGRLAVLTLAISLFMRDTIINLQRAASHQKDCYSLLLGAVAMSPWGIHKVQRLLMTRGEAVSSAAMVASIIGSRPVEELHARGLSTLRGVSMDQLKLEHLRAPNRPKKAKTPVLNRRGGGVIREGSSVALQLSQKIRLQTPAATLVPALLTSVTPRAELLASASRPAKFGCVDAFISHSWLDDPRAKWDALQTWRSDFVAQYRREPIVWLDRLCIDQTAITESLPLLPVYLAGCNSLLVLAGPTYMQRLWCWVEIFVWLEIGGEARDTVILPLANFSLGDEIDVRRATCYLPEDTDRLLSTVDASTLHGVEAFNGRVRALFVRALFLRESDRSLRSVRSRTRSPSHKLSIGRFSSARDSARPRIGGQIVVE